MEPESSLPPAKATLDDLMPVYYAELRQMARNCLAGERDGHTLQPTALVHEAYMRLASQQKVDWQCRPQVLGLAARMMRRILVNYAEARSAEKRDGGVRVALESGVDGILEEALGLFADGAAEVAALDRALSKLDRLDERQGRIVEMRFFGGLTVDETALALEISTATVKREWQSARLFLASELEGNSP